MGSIQTFSATNARGEAFILLGIVEGFDIAADLLNHGLALLRLAFDLIDSAEELLIRRSRHTMSCTLSDAMRESETCLDRLLGLDQILLALLGRLALLSNLPQDGIVGPLDLHLETRHSQIHVHQRLLCQIKTKN